MEGGKKEDGPRCLCGFKANGKRERQRKTWAKRMNANPIAYADSKQRTRERSRASRAEMRKDPIALADFRQRETKDRENGGMRERRILLCMRRTRFSVGFR